ncbi:MAG TPA: response regulator [Bryobacteraceae bacterium]|nr:response regulator [Bryobacteraceae bacterium]
MAKASSILIVEDSETQALQLQLLLEAEGWEVTCASSGESALVEIARSRPDLLVVDYYLPGIRGDELCRRVRGDPHTRSVSILMLTAEEGGIGALEVGADDCVSKSEGSRIVVQHVRALLREREGGPSPGFRGGRLLAIDDSPTHLAYLSATLTQEGYEVEQALSGAVGLVRIAQDDLDCVLVDLVMPDMDGIEVCRRITAMRQTLRNPLAVIIVTSRETEEDMTRGLEAGADDFVSKSSDLSVLRARIRALLRRGFFQQENRRIIEELKLKELETLRARSHQEAAEVRAAMAEELARTNQELENANRKLKETHMHLLQTEKMASLGQLVAGIAHEINNPLAFVLTHLFTINSALDGITREAQAHLSEAGTAKLKKVRLRLHEMEQGLDRVKELVLSLRTFSRLDEGEFKDIDVHESIDSVLLFLQHKMRGRIQLEKRYGQVGKLACFAGQLNQVIMNLVANAIDAIHGPGTIWITTGQSQEAAFITVQDSGKGIPENIRHKIFEPFFTTKPVGEGTGLGLAISYGIIQAHGGVIEVESEEGVGTKFTIRIRRDLKNKSAA